VKPLLRAVTLRQTAFLLALAEGSVRLLEVTPGLRGEVPDLPTDAADAAGKASIADRSPARRLQGTEGRKTLSISEIPEDELMRGFGERRSSLTQRRWWLWPTPGSLDSRRC
jgi:Bacterial archaeo-eukaryotic release factor family 11